MSSRRQTIRLPAGRPPVSPQADRTSARRLTRGFPAARNLLIINALQNAPRKPPTADNDRTPHPSAGNNSRQRRMPGRRCLPAEGSIGPTPA
ncbi:hypothetical protein [uncultured Bacteroides sp.]|uniref:hypothetical protein n=1 Tax=uncultured Bacteroides sp. TaxID=162156 RepID=UPI00260B6B99|nr:hypothetical protein [uncultured Bacteroides sp.]